MMFCFQATGGTASPPLLLPALSSLPYALCSQRGFTRASILLSLADRGLCSAKMSIFKKNQKRMEKKESVLAWLCIPVRSVTYPDGLKWSSTSQVRREQIRTLLMGKGPDMTWDADKRASRMCRETTFKVTYSQKCSRIKGKPSRRWSQNCLFLRRFGEWGVMFECLWSKREKY